ncbi:MULTISPECIES: TonB-dependent siderophore receptor [unclassified Janthinobacterium]|uniref:TonB-dependent siderophore receptor n=1 Tax=unclassified Janthinobacterium TaxID=2610881 RepID=UPI001A300B90|nr:TonB-dependent siderophore receptor [Janthinobacterium sp. CG_23.4]MDH6157614.1 iron complex outermembrane receptor protein [Janthinobacterium sp. CG_23.4]
MLHSLPRPMALLLAAASPLALADGLAAQDVVTVSSERQHYRSLSATGATKTDASLMDLPQSVRVLTSDLLRDAGVTTLAGALDLASGIAKQSSLGGLWDSYAMRGFTGDPNFGSDYMVNGFSSSRGYNGMRDAGNTQTVEVLKGPASALYGRGEPGGTVNITTKKPKFAPEYSAYLSLGSFQTRRAALDLTGPLSQSVAYRLNAAHEEGHSFRDTLHVERSLFSLSFLWLIGEHTTVSYEIEAVQQRAPFDRGVVAVHGKLGLVPVARFLGEPGDGRMTVKSLGQQLFIHHGLSDDWTLQAGASYRDSELNGYSTEANKLLADGRTLNRQRRHRDFTATDVSARVELLGKFKTGALAHEVLAGVDAYHFDDHRVQLRRNPGAANAYAVDIFNPVYGGQAAPLALSIDTQEGQQARGLYVQDQLDLGAQWKALVGVRRDTYTQDVVNNRLNVSNRQSLSATSPRAGLVYRPSKNWSLYASAAKGFRPNSGISIDNQAFPAERSRSYELGAKLETGKLTGTVAVYDIRKSNVLTTNRANTDFAIAAGEVGSRGLELDVAGEVARRLRVSGAYAYTDATVTRGDNTIVTGSRFANVPRHSAKLLATQQLTMGTGTASVGGGVHYVGKRQGDVAVSSSFTLPAYTTAQLLASYSPNAQLRLALSVENLFNRSYYASSYSPLWVAPGAERTLTVHAHYRF